MDTVKQIRIFEIEGSASTGKTASVAVEQAVHIHVNGQRRAVLTATPQHLKELALGYLLSTGLIRGLADISRLTSDADFRAVWVEAACNELPLVPVSDDLRVQPADIFHNMEQFLCASAVFFATGAVHSCALMVGGQLLHFMEDIGRHNAFDKTVGAALYEKKPLDRAVILTTGRVPGDMMTKVIYSRSQIIVSHAAPTDAAVELALRYNVTLCGFARGRRINIYTGGHRIQYDS